MAALHHFFLCPMLSDSLLFFFFCRFIPLEGVGVVPISEENPRVELAKPRVERRNENMDAGGRFFSCMFSTHKLKEKSGGHSCLVALSSFLFCINHEGGMHERKGEQNVKKEKVAGFCCWILVCGTCIVTLCLFIWSVFAFHLSLRCDVICLSRLICSK